MGGEGRLKLLDVISGMTMRVSFEAQDGGVQAERARLVERRRLKAEKAHRRKLIQERLASIRHLVAGEHNETDFDEMATSAEAAEWVGSQEASRASNWDLGFMEVTAEHDVAPVRYPDARSRELLRWRRFDGMMSPLEARSAKMVGGHAETRLEYVRWAEQTTEVLVTVDYADAQDAHDRRDEATAREFLAELAAAKARARAAAADRTAASVRGEILARKARADVDAQAAYRAALAKAEGQADLSQSNLSLSYDQKEEETTTGSLRRTAFTATHVEPEAALASQELTLQAPEDGELLATHERMLHFRVAQHRKLSRLPNPTPPTPAKPLPRP